MRFKLILAGLLMLLPFPALADVTAHYGMGDHDHLVIEADDGGDLRATFSEKFAIIRRGGVDYVVLALPNGETRIADLGAVVDLVAAQVKGQTPPSGGGGKAMFEMKAAGTGSFAGYDGAVWLVAPAPDAPQPKDEPFQVLLSSDPALAPIGGFFHRFCERMGPLVGLIAGGDTNIGEIVTALFAKGAPLRVGEALRLESVDHGQVAAARFELPGPVGEPLAFLQAALPSDSGAGLSPLP